MTNQYNIDRFAAACSDMNSMDELEEALRGPADARDCQEWGLSPEDWREAIEDAIDMLENDGGPA